MKRENIFSLIGRGRYHSCILTTFSFDFYFFEMKVMRWLHSQGIRNVHLYIDGNFLSHWMQTPTGDEMQLNPGYSILPVFGRKVFHPKLWFLTGRNEGLLILGSGNLTSSGHGSNLETWSAFHFSDKEPNSAKLFSQAWEYLQYLARENPPLVKQKTIDWLIEQSPWLAGLPIVKRSEFLTLPNGDEVTLLWNGDRSTIWGDITRMIGTENITNICSLSPFYDKNGDALQTLAETFPAATFQVICEEKGQVPSDFKPLKNFNFHDLCSVSAYDHEKQLAHAKLLLFQTKNETEYLLLGSANNSVEGLGIKGVRQANDELSLLMKRSHSGFLKELGIKISSASRRKLSDFVINENSFGHLSGPSSDKTISIQWVELFGDILSLFFTLRVEDDLKIHLFTNENRLLGIFPVSVKDTKVEVKISGSGFQVHTVVLFRNEKPCSNRSLVHRFEQIIKTHPNPRSEEIESIHQQMLEGDLSRIFQLLQFIPVDLSEDEVALGSESMDSKRAQQQIEDGKDLPLLDISSYKVQDTFSAHYEKTLAYSSVDRVLDILRKSYTGFFSQQKQSIREDEQIDDAANYSGNEETEVQSEIPSGFKELQHEQKAVLRYLKGLSDYYSYLLNETPQDQIKISITELTKYLIATELLIEYTGKTRSYCLEERTFTFKFLGLDTETAVWQLSLLVYLMQLTAWFLRLCQQGFKTYELPYTINKLENFKKEALISTLFCIINVRWREDQQRYCVLLLLNTLYYLGAPENNVLKTMMKEELERRKLQNVLISIYYSDNAFFFNEQVLPKYYAFLENIKRPVKERKTERIVMKNDIIFSSRKGFASVNFAIEKAGVYEIKLSRPGLNWDSTSREFIDPETWKVKAVIKVMSL